MSFSHSSLSAQVKSHLTFLPEEIRQKILEHLHSVIHYEPVIGIMGKSGTGDVYKRQVRASASISSGGTGRYPGSLWITDLTRQAS